MSITEPRSLNRVQTLTDSVWARVAIIAGGALLLASQIIFIPSRDSSAFLFIAERMLHGARPYADLWDHKPPAIYFVDAVGLLLGGKSLVGVWLIEVATFCGAGLLSLATLERAFGRIPSLFATAVWMICAASLVGRGNMSEEYPLVLQFCALFLFVTSEQKGRYGWRAVAIGAASAAAFLFKPNLIGVWFGIGLFFIIFKPKRLLQLPAMLVGALAVFGAALGYLLATGTLPAMLDEVWHYNAAYAGGSTFLSSLRAAADSFAAAPPLAIALVAWAAGLRWLLGRPKADEQRFPLRALAVITFPIEILLVSITGRTYIHYYLALLPVLAILLAWAMEWAISYDHAKGVQLARRGLTALTLATLLMPMFHEAVKFAVAVRGYSSLQNRASLIIKATTKPNDKILVWGAEALVYFWSDRLPPTRYFYQYPLITKGYASEEIVRSFTDDVRKGCPAIIIDTANKRMPPLDPAARASWAPKESELQLGYVRPPKNIDSFFAFVERNYRPAEHVDKWRVWRRSAPCG